MSGGLGLQGIDTKNKVLRCPRDHQVMEEVNKNASFIDICNKCGGMFFDQGEMFGAAGLKADPSYWDRPETGGIMKESPLHCSRCDGHMLAQDVAQNGVHVEIDRCAHCGGIWLDEGEIEKIIEIGEKMRPIVEAERDQARRELEAMGDDPFGSPGLIASFLALFGLGKKRKK
jgi:Zn-finger nucleic acid-binding protein